MRFAWRCALLLVGIFLTARCGGALDPAWTRAVPPFRIAGNLYYVGSEELASYLIATPDGLILINSNLASSPDQIEHSVEQLGFRLKDVKILLISHAHFDHAAGSAEILRRTGAKYYVMEQDVSVVESGGRTDFAYGADQTMWFPRAHVDRALHDGDTVALGGTVLTAHLTAGHTKGTLTWTLEENENGRLLHVVIVGSPNLNSSYKLVGNLAYPQIVSDYRHGFEVLKGLPCDVFLGSHGSYFDLTGKYSRLKSGEAGAFVDPEGYKAFVADRELAFETVWKQQSAAK